jgi:hypothetical protein
VTDSVLDINAAMFDHDGDLDEEAAHAYERDLARLFEQSPEGMALAAEGVELGFAGTIVHYLVGYESVSVPDMTAAQFETVLFEVIPRKVTVEPDEARGLVLEARGFCAYLHRAHGLANAAECLAAIKSDGAIDRLREALSDPRNWGMAKSLVMQGKESGFDVSSKAGLEEWFAAYNASLPSPASPTSRQVLPGASRGAAVARRRKRKQQKTARRKNR